MFQIGVCQDPIEIAGQIENLDSEIEDAKIVVRSFPSAEKTDDLVKMIREPERMGPLVESFYKNRGELSKTGIEEIRN
jgi:mevalonate kinase